MLLSEKEHVPMLLVEFDDEMDICLLAGFGGRHGTTAERCAQLHAAGRMLGQRNQKRAPRSLALLSEVWFTEHRGERASYPYRGPSQDPNKREALMCLSLEVKTQQQRVHVAEILRVGDAIDLYTPFEQPSEPQSDLLLEALRGVQVGRYEKPGRGKR